MRGSLARLPGLTLLAAGCSVAVCSLAGCSVADRPAPQPSRAAAASAWGQHVIALGIAEAVDQYFASTSKRAA